MERVISGHLRNEVAKNCLLLTSFIPFKNIANNELVYDGIKYADYMKFHFLTIIYYNFQHFKFECGTYEEDNSDMEEDDEEREINEMIAFDVYDGAPNINHESSKYSRSILKLTNNSFFFDYDNVNIYLYDNSYNVSYHLEINDHLEDIYFNKDGRITKIDSEHFKYSQTDGKVKIPRKLNETVDDLLYQGKKSLSYKIMKGNKVMFLYISFNSEKVLTRYGMFSVEGSKREGFFYKLDDSGNFIISSFVDNKSHGYYFDSGAQEQGFYENGIKVGFWKEQGQIINYDTDRIFYPIPVFFL